MKMAHCEDMSDFEASESFHHDSKKQIPVALIIPTMHGLKSYWGVLNQINKSWIPFQVLLDF